MRPVTIFAFAGALALAAAAVSQQATAPPTSRPAQGDPYTLGTCPVSGMKLGSMGDPVVKAYEGREVRFCCDGCIEKFEGNKAEMFKKIDAELVKQQLPYYPLTTCPVSGEPLVEDGEDIAVNAIHQNRLVRFCCKVCQKKFMRDPEPHLKKLDAAVAAAQGSHYPLATCMVSGEPLDAMGGPADMIAGNRLVRFCCKGCFKGFRKSPATYLATLDAAWKKHGMPWHGHGHDGGHGHGHDHDHDHDGH